MFEILLSFVYRPYAYTHHLNDFHLADSYTSFLGVPLLALILIAVAVLLIWVKLPKVGDEEQKDKRGEKLMLSWPVSKGIAPMPAVTRSGSPWNEYFTYINKRNKKQ